jgi:hypothetical protein
MIKYFSSRKKGISIFCLLLFLFQLFQPTISFALTGGPSQPEVQSFQPAGTSDMVDLFSGDFSYNIPLFELPGPNGGYPFNLSYQAGIGMDQEASWVGLGWSLNPGAITRQMRGLPDEFKGDPIKTTMSIKPNITVGLGAGIGAEIFGLDKKGNKNGNSFGYTLGFTVSQNTYKGLGYSIDSSLGYERAVGGGMTGGIGLQFSLDSNEGVNLQPSLSLAGKIGQVGLQAGYNSKSGLSNISYSHSITREISGENVNKNSRRGDHKATMKFNTSASLSHAHPGYTPQITMPMRNTNLAAEFKPGGAWWALFPNAYIKGFYNEQTLVNDNKQVTTEAYGYLNYQSAGDDDALLDFNREKDGMVTKESPNLAIPSLSYDIYSVTGQGISAMYRPMRNDYGLVHDQQVTSTSTGYSAGVDVGPAASHVGVNLSVNHSNSTSGSWTEDNNMNVAGEFQYKYFDRLYEPWYFKVHGEMNAEQNQVITDIGGDKAVRVKLSGGSNLTTSAENTFENPVEHFKKEFTGNAIANQDRKTRNQVIQPITNEQLLLKGKTEILPQFRITYIESNGVEQPYDRSIYLGKTDSHEDAAHHIAGYTALTPEGLRYNYALPAYNNKQVEVTFSVKGSTVSRQTVYQGVNASDDDPSPGDETTDQFFKSVEIPRYAHAHFLTSIFGPDYVDVKGDGVTEDDLGYWVKFTYKRTASNYKWRDPFLQAHYSPGWKYNFSDDKGSFVYGEKEMWYLAKAETKTHIAVFTLDSNARTDGRGAKYKLQGTDVPTPVYDAALVEGSVYRLKEIKLYTRAAGPGAPIKIIELTHDNRLCPGAPNSSSGKLTLTNLSFKYGSSSKSLNPYTFTYFGVNPSYSSLAYDRWGNYKPYSTLNRDFPYVPQIGSKSQVDQNAAVWSLVGIDLPSGGKITVDYESDDYGYVQHKPAMQMMEVVDPDAPDHSNFNNPKINLESDRLKVRFKLEIPINGAITDAGMLKDEVQKYLDPRGQLYFKLKMNLRGIGDNVFDYISGYAEIDPNAPMGLEKEGSSADYTHGYFSVKAEPVKKIDGTVDQRNPFSMRAWQHLRTNQPELSNPGRKLKRTGDSGEQIDQIKSLGSIGWEIRTMFEGFYKACADKKWGREIEVGTSWIRLNSPDKIKYGGGLRVKQITMSDEWKEQTDKDLEGVYGQVYDYTIKENGKLISSGVASYEPIVGGEENALRYSKKYVQSVPLHSDNNLFFEYPINESYYPGPQVGYRKVTVWSLASAFLAKQNDDPAHPNPDYANLNVKFPDNIKAFPNAPGLSYGTTGKTEHEFYTAKDFPVITDETDKLNKPYKLSVPVPLLGSIAISKLTTSQGYSIVTNDMHGKPKKISNYKQDKFGKPETEPISWVQYNYRSKERMYDGEKVNELVNTFKLEDGALRPTNDKDDPSRPADIPADDQQTNSQLYYRIGQETELFTDMRQYEDKVWSGGATFNTDILYVPILVAIVPVPMPSVWPNVSKSKSTMRSAVTNKVVFKSGIMTSTEAYDGGSKIITRNLKWDQHTGVPVVTTVNNNFDLPIYNYSILAHKQYAGMGAAYENVGATFHISSVIELPQKKGFYDFYSSLPAGTLFPGDEIIVYEDGSNLRKPLAKVVYTGQVDGDNLIYAETKLDASNYECMIVRSGYRNQLAVSAGTITALNSDPSKTGPLMATPKVITIVK